MIGMWEEICRDGLTTSTLKSTSEENSQVVYSVPYGVTLHIRNLSIAR